MANGNSITLSGIVCIKLTVADDTKICGRLGTNRNITLCAKQLLQRCPGSWKEAQELEMTIRNFEMRKLEKKEKKRENKKKRNLLVAAQR
jgi:hypothetical protein